MTKHKHVRRPIWVLCTTCFGSGAVGKDGQRKRCNACDGKGEVEKWLVEIVNDDKGQEVTG